MAPDSDTETMEQAKIPARYRLLREVGQGGMAVVYRAVDETLKREVAIKILHQHLAADLESKARLEREAQSVAKLHHENILEIFDYSGPDSPSSFIVTEFIDGQTLKELLAARPITYPEVAALIAVEIGGALAHAHAAGIIHRDVKPENVMIRKDGVLKLMDFGIAQVIDLQRMTVTGQLLGSPAYMAPELIEGKPLDFRTDVFAVGIMLYQLATGALPFSGKNPHEVLRRIVEGKFPDPRTLNKRLSDGLARVLGRALARRPDDRYPGLAQFTADLREHLAEAGLTDVKRELRAYFADPAAYEAALPARLAAGLSASADEALRAGRKGKAIEAWSRVLAFDPQNADVLSALRRLEGRARLRRIGLVAGGGAALVAALLGLARL
ncbi:MAG TPA: serine/threonine-protein kinase, partial [Polyangia bacterium]|nr:serine/threonine-protein kinase [Polyangia bacterium]